MLAHGKTLIRKATHPKKWFSRRKPSISDEFPEGPTNLKLGSPLPLIPFEADLSDEDVLQRLGLNLEALPWIPSFLMNFVEDHGLKEEGLFRLAGSASEIKTARTMIDEGGRIRDLVQWAHNCKSMHSVAGLLKAYFRELPEPLLTFELYDCFIASYGKLEPILCLDSCIRTSH